MEHRVPDHCVVFVRQGKLLISDKGRTEEIPAGSCVFLKKDCSVRLPKRRLKVTSDFYGLTFS